jgi:hypothetical protein
MVACFSPVGRLVRSWVMCMGSGQGKTFKFKKVVVETKQNYLFGINMNNKRIAMN